MAEVINMPIDSLYHRGGNGGSGRDRRDDSNLHLHHLHLLNDVATEIPKRDRRTLNRCRESDYYDRNRSPPPPDRERKRDYKRRNNMSPPPPLPYRDRRESPPPWRSPPYKRLRREDGGYDARRGSSRGGFGPGDCR